jgi:hypothetical protein
VSLGEWIIPALCLWLAFVACCFAVRLAFLDYECTRLQEENRKLKEWKEAMLDYKAVQIHAERLARKWGEA